MFDILPFREGLHDAADVFIGQPVVVRHLDKFSGGINKEHAAVIAVLFQHHDAGGDGRTEKEVGRQLDDAVDKVIVDQVLADLLLRPAPVHDAREADDGGRPAGREPGQGMHDEGKVRLGFRRQHPRG